MVVTTILLAFSSALFRGFISVLDRYLFGFKNACIRNANLVNNFLAFLMILAAGGWLIGWASAVDAILDWNSFFFALLLQLNAYAFSFAFRTMKVHHVIVVSKSADLLIPFALVLAGSGWNWTDAGFSFLTFLACLPILVLGVRSNGISVPASLLVCLSLVVQGGLSPVLIGHRDPNLNAWLGYTISLLFWRFVLSVIPVLRHPRDIVREIRAVIKPRVFEFVALRSFLTIGAQLFLVLALGLGIKMLAWPILNSTGLLAAVIAPLFLKEPPQKSDLISIGLITALAVARSLM